MDVRFQFLRQSSEIGKTLRDDGWQVETEGNNYLSAHHPEATNEFTARTRLLKLGLLTSSSLRAADLKLQSPDGRRTLTAVESRAPIVVDGALDEEVWRARERASPSDVIPGSSAQHSPSNLLLWNLLQSPCPSRHEKRDGGGGRHAQTADRSFPSHTHESQDYDAHKVGSAVLSPSPD